MNKRLLITSTELMMVQFLVPHVMYLSRNGFDVEIAGSDVGGRMNEVKEKLQDYVKAIHVVRLVRSPVSSTNLKGYGDMRRVIEQGNYDIIWTNEPVMGVVTRLAARDARRRGTKVLYMVHGFHFYKGAPLINWMLFYPIESFASRFCDEIVTINHEDEAIARKMHAPSVKYIHGIGVNTDRLHSRDRGFDIREELGLPKDAFILLSVGELNENKNQTTVLRAMERIRDPKLHYVLCGKGDQLEALQKQSERAGLNDRVHFLGYRNDVVDICSQADAFVMPSHREGLPVAALEAMYCGLPMVVSNIRGLTDVVENGVSGFLCSPNDDKAFANAILKLKEDPLMRKRMAEHNRISVAPFCLGNTKKEVIQIIKRFVSS